MKELERIFTQKNLHHAYVIEGGEGALSEILQLIETSRGIKITGNPDVHVREYDSFGIDDGRAIQALESKKAVTGHEKFFILSLRSITREAQNALLKMFEEPTSGTHFFLLLPSATQLLDTLQSRVEVVKPSRDTHTNLLAKQFLSANPAARLSLITDIVESKDKYQALEFVNGLESLLYSSQSLNDPDSVPTEAFETLLTTRSYLNDRSSSVKILLEHVAVSLPRVSI